MYLQALFRNLSRVVTSIKNEVKTCQLVANMINKEEPLIDIAVDYVKLAETCPVHEVCSTLKTDYPSAVTNLIKPIIPRESSPLFVMATDKLFSLNNVKRQFRKTSKLQQNTRLKMYSYNYIKTKKMRQNNNTNFRFEENKSFLDKIRKLFRETIKIKTNKTIMNKNNSCYFKNVSCTDGDVNDNVQTDNDCNETDGANDGNKNIKFKETAKPNWKATNINPKLSNHILSQAEKSESVDPDVVLNCPNYPYLPCPLKTLPSTNYVINGPYQSYKHTSLAPMFSLDSVIINKLKQNRKLEKQAAQSVQDKEGSRPCIGEKFWSQHVNDKEMENGSAGDRKTMTSGPSGNVGTANMVGTTVEEAATTKAAMTVGNSGGVNNDPVDKLHRESNKQSANANNSNKILDIDSKVKINTTVMSIPVPAKKEQLSLIPEESRLNVNNNFNKAPMDGETKQASSPPPTMNKENKTKQTIHARFFIENKETKSKYLNCSQSMTSMQLSANNNDTNTKPVTQRVAKKKSEINLMKQKIDIPLQKKKQLLKEINKFYEKKDIKQATVGTNNLQTKIEREKNKLKPKAIIKSQYPLTSPSALRKRE